MTKINLNKDEIKFNNLCKSFFSDIKNISCDVSDKNVIIYENSNKNPDPASVELKIESGKFLIYFWDGYSLADKFTESNYNEALKVFKKFAKKLAKNLKRF